jgi:hypothetical protein
MAEKELQVLDLTGEPERPTVKLPEGEFKMRLAEELTFKQFGRQISIGQTLMDRAAEAAQPGENQAKLIKGLQTLIVESAHMILIDLTDEAAAALTPGRYLKVNNFFNKLATQERIMQRASEPGLSSVPDASDSSETQEGD